MHWFPTTSEARRQNLDPMSWETFKSGAASTVELANMPTVEWMLNWSSVVNVLQGLQGFLHAQPYWGAQQDHLLVCRQLQSKDSPIMRPETTVIAKATSVIIPIAPAFTSPKNPLKKGIPP